MLHLYHQLSAATNLVELLLAFPDGERGNQKRQQAAEESHEKLEELDGRAARERDLNSDGNRELIHVDEKGGVAFVPELLVTECVLEAAS